MPPIARTVLGLAAAFGVAWLGSLILGEYPFTGYVPIVGGFLLGVSAVAAAAYVERSDPPAWAIVVATGFAVWGEWRAAWIDAGGFGPLPWEAYAAMAAAAVGGLVRLIPPPKRKREGDGGDGDMAGADIADDEVVGADQGADPGADQGADPGADRDDETPA